MNAPPQKYDHREMLGCGHDEEEVNWMDVVAWPCHFDYERVLRNDDAYGFPSMLWIFKHMVAAGG